MLSHSNNKLLLFFTENTAAETEIGSCKYVEYDDIYNE